MVIPITDSLGVYPMVGVGFKQQTSDKNPSGVSPLSEFTFVTWNEDRPIFKIVGRISDSQEKYVIIRDYAFLIEGDIDMRYRVEVLSLENWHAQKDHIPYYDRLVHELRSEDDLQRFYLEDLLEPTVEWRPENGV